MAAVVEARCLRHGIVATGDRWGQVLTAATVHGCIGAVRLAAVFTPAAWARVPGDYKHRSPDGRLAVLHHDAGATILVPAEVRP